MLCERVEKAGFWTCAGNMSKAVDILLALRDFVYGAVLEIGPDRFVLWRDSSIAPPTGRSKI